MKFRLLIILLYTMIQGCTTVDDFLLGKDNTNKPRELKQIQSKVNISQNWAVAVGKPHQSNDYLKLKPLVVKDVIYTAEANGLVQAQMKKDGQLKWSHQLKHGIVSGPSIKEGLVALGTNAATLVVLNQADGTVRWQSKIFGEMLSPPAIAQGKVIAKTIDGKVFAFDATTGKQLWVANHGAPSLVLKASSSPVVLGNLVLIGFSDGKLEALNLETGQTVWQRSIAYASGSSDVERLVDIDSDPIVKDNIAYLASYQGYIGALSLADGQFLWRKPASVYKNMVLHSNTLYLTDSNDILWSLNAHSGQVNWKQSALKARGLTEPVLMGTRLVVGDKTGYLHIVSVQTGKLLGRTQLSSSVSISPTAVGSHVYVLTDNGMLNQLSVS
ncbi:MAG: outer membrane protein assembly factor BamB [Legionella sp.]|nr:outer membrane protein assembly factor BamB [Legionella sp.]